MPAPTAGAMRDEDWRSLTSAIENGTCILMLGPDAFIAEFDGEMLPLRRGVRHAGSSTRSSKTGLGPDDADVDPVQSVDRRAGRGRQGGRVHAASWAKDFYETHNTVSDDTPHACLAAVRSSSSAPRRADRRTACSDEAKPATHSDFYDWTAPARTSMPDPIAETRRSSTTCSARCKNTDSMLLSDHDRFEFLDRGDQGEPATPEKLLSRLRDRNQSFLFVGFDLMQWQLRMLIHVLANNVQRVYKSFALELDEAARRRRGADVLHRAATRCTSSTWTSPSSPSELRTGCRELDGTPRPTVAPPGNRHGNGTAPALGPRRADGVRLPRPRGRGLRRAGQRRPACEQHQRVARQGCARAAAIPGTTIIEERIQHDVNYCVVLQSAQPAAQGRSATSTRRSRSRSTASSSTATPASS